MKYKYGDIVYYIHTKLPWPAPMQVLRFDEKTGKYLCVDTLEISPADETTCLYLVAEKDLDYFSNVDEEDARLVKEDFNSIFPEDMDTDCFNIYDQTDEGEKDYRLATKSRMEFEVPRKRKS